MEYKKQFLSIVSSIIFSIFFILPVFSVDRALVWDDWIWIYSSQEQLRDVAVQLGLWWLAEANVFIYSLQNPHLFLSSLAFVSNIISVFLIGRALLRLRIFTENQCALWSACCIISPYLVVRYSNSVSFYSLYFLLFVCGSYLLIFNKNKLIRLLSAPLFLLSFSLSSLICGFFLVVIFADGRLLNVIFFSIRDEHLSINKYLKRIFKILLQRLREIWVWLLLPLTFFAIKYLSPYPKPSSDPYQFYNIPQIDGIFLSPLKTFLVETKIVLKVLIGGFSSFETIGFYIGVLYIATVIVICYFLNKINLVKTGFRLDKETCTFKLQSIIALFVISYFLLFPYVVVGKSPQLNDFIESRHFIPASPFVFAAVFMVIIYLGDLISRVFPILRGVSLLALFVFTSSSISKAYYSAALVWFENFTTTYVIEQLKNNVSDIDLWVFDDQRPPALFTRWNYVYTGYLISAFGNEKDKFGIGKGEYLEWDKPVPLLSNSYYRDRYNIKDYIHSDSFNKVFIRALRGSSPNAISYYYLRNLFSTNKIKASDFVGVNFFSHYGCVDQIVSYTHPESVVNRSLLKDHNNFCENYSINILCNAKANSEETVVFKNKLDTAYSIQAYSQLLDNNSKLFINTTYWNNLSSAICKP